MMFYATRNYGLSNKRCRRIGLIQNGLNGASGKVCSERVKTVVRQHSQSSSVIPGEITRSL
ncbi:hypothetical protein CITSP_03070 [Citrobacter sp. T1.2D-1]|nr:hypothetical protein CITSP_03070 [Citrobacter sp. T1.2D-1]